MLHVSSLPGEYSTGSFGKEAYNFIDMLASTANTVILPVQDILILDSDTRVNTPASSENNRAYRVTKEQPDSINRSEYRYYNSIYARI